MLRWQRLAPRDPRGVARGVANPGLDTGALFRGEGCVCQQSQQSLDSTAAGLQVRGHFPQPVAECGMPLLHLLQ